MSKSLYVGNIPWSVTSEELVTKFGEFGEVADARVVKEKDSGRSKGFGFVDMIDDSAAAKAIEALNGYNWGGRNIVVNEAKPKTPNRF
jgi:RNA recognition motif-containing protein